MMDGEGFWVMCQTERSGEEQCTRYGSRIYYYGGDGSVTMDKAARVIQLGLLP